MIGFVVSGIDDSGGVVKLTLTGRVDGCNYPPHQIVEIDASQDDFVWRPPDMETPLVGKPATWDGLPFVIESAYLKPGSGMVVALATLDSD
jgi:hypothetical protein